MCVYSHMTIHETQPTSLINLYHYRFDLVFHRSDLLGKTLFLLIDLIHVLHIQGDILALLGPTLLDIAHHVSGSDNSIPVIFSARSVGYLVGSVTGGVLYDKYRTKRYAMLSASVVISALCKWRYS